MNIYIYIYLYIITSSVYAADLNVQIKPDTLHVGTLVTINISVIDMQTGEYPVFYDIAEQPNMYSIVDLILHDYSADYTLQFWESGLIIIPSIQVDIKRNKQNIAKLQSDSIKISISSSINDSNGNTIDALRDIKPIQDVKFISVYNILIYILLLIIGISLVIYFWKYQKERQSLDDQKKYYNKSIFQETIRSLQALKIPTNINRSNTEKYYFELSHIFRIFIKEEYFIRATEMTSYELEIYFHTIGVDDELVNDWSQINKIADMAKYAGAIPAAGQFNKNREDFINIIKSFHKIIPRISL